MMASNGFNHPKDRPANVWGGAMMFRAEELRRNIYGLTDAWRDGGYSEDFITLTLARYHKRSLAVPKTALFPNELGSVQFDRFWNFMCRQIFVLTQTYATSSQRFISLAASFFNASCHLFIFLGCTLSLMLTSYVALSAARRASTDSGTAASGPFGGLGLGDTCASSGAVPSALAFWPLLLIFGLVAKRVLTSFTMLCNVLSPHGYGNEPIDASHVSVPLLCLAYMLYAPLIPAAVRSSAADAPRATGSGAHLSLPAFPPARASLATTRSLSLTHTRSLTRSLTLCPPLSCLSSCFAASHIPLLEHQTVVTLFCSHIVWAGVDFHITNGRVSAMYRKDGKDGKTPVGEWYTVPAEQSLEKSMRELAEFRLQNDGLISSGR